MGIIQEYIRIAHLLAKKLLWSLTENEEQQLVKWYTEKGKKCESILSLHFTQLLERYQKIDSNREWEKFQQRLDKKKSRIWKRLMEGAAGICLVVGVSFLLRWQMDDRQQVVIGDDDGLGIHLIMSNGKKLNLSDRRSFDLRQVERNVVLHSGSLDYRENTVADGEETGVNTLVVPKGAFYHLILSEGTKVWLNSDSKITYPILFSGNTREVELEGEAFFDVAKDMEHPFLVKTKVLQVQVLGTCFNVNTHGDDGRVFVALERGKVEVGNIEGKGMLLLKPGEVAEIAVNQRNAQVKLSNVSLQEQIAWKEGMFCFRRMPLSEILKQVARYYNVQFVGGEEIERDVYSGDISRNVTLEELLKAIESQTDEIRFEVVGKVVYVIKKRD